MGCYKFDYGTIEGKCPWCLGDLPEGRCPWCNDEDAGSE